MPDNETTQMENPHLAHYARLVAEQRDEIQALRLDAARYRWLRDRDRHLHPDVDDVTWAATCARNIDAEIEREESARAK